MQDMPDGEDEFPSAPVDQPEETAFFITEDVRKQGRAGVAQDIEDVAEEAQSREQSIDEANMRRRRQQIPPRPTAQMDLDDYGKWKVASFQAYSR